MDVQRLYCLKHWVKYSSFTLSLENYVVLTNSLLLLQSDNHFKKILFWGVLQGLEADYYISFGYEKDALVGRKYFYSDDCLNWKLLPVPQREHLVLTELCKRPFQGDPGLVVEVVDDSSEDIPDQDASVSAETGGGDGETEIETNQSFVTENERKLSTLSGEQSLRKSKETTTTSSELKEEDRLAATVQLISDEAAIVPRGGLFKQTDGTCVHSRAFEGIKLEDADSMCSFQHYRAPRHDYNTNLMIRCDYNYALDFLDTIDKDLPADCWSAQLVEGDRSIILRSLHWPGLMFFHYLNSPDHGFIYVGQGLRNLDIPFMTQVKIPSHPVNLLDDSSEEENEDPKISAVTGQSRLSRGSRPSTRLSTKLDTKLNTKLSTKLDTKPSEKLGTKLETKQSEKLGTKLDTKQSEKLGTKLSTKLETKLGTKLSVKTDS
ncbi:radial spoke head protein 9 homolog [Macrosteles quadrilineatus]|uniref:radial spoke head protein 9 homolog n=1 Tax=Macrosteles quadrilineatus TaxID=74068 RepID=UPI0023E27A58|nr:radial spoke head protein 9 homolog [Macrosteles quadrilineatus]XP_054265451.1 radial spoke head protein 9 homolog [Macrosteles quadrilineatus]